MSSVKDQLGRPLRDLRISVIDQCNFRCTYCMPEAVFGPDYAFLKRDQLLSRVQIARLVRAFSALGVDKIRITGGEPLLRKEVPSIVEDLSRIDSIADIALTTNGWLLPHYAQKLKAAGLHRINVSLDSLEDETFMSMNGRAKPVSGVLKGIDAAVAAGLPVKINMMVQKDKNVQDILPMTTYFRDRGITLRFIEYMDVGNFNHWDPARVITASEILRTVGERFPLEPIDPNYKGEVAKRYRFLDGKGEIGLISSISQPFCRDCHRARLSADGKLYTCLFATRGKDLKPLLHTLKSNGELTEALGRIWRGRHDRYSELRMTQPPSGPSEAKVEMSYIGG